MWVSLLLWDTHISRPRVLCHQLPPTPCIPRLSFCQFAQQSPRVLSRELVTSCYWWGRIYILSTTLWLILMNRLYFIFSWTLNCGCLQSMLCKSIYSLDSSRVCFFGNMRWQLSALVVRFQRIRFKLFGVQGFLDMIRLFYWDLPQPRISKAQESWLHGIPNLIFDFFALCWVLGPDLDQLPKEKSNSAMRSQLRYVDWPQPFLTALGLHFMIWSGWWLLHRSQEVNAASFLNS